MQETIFDNMKGWSNEKSQQGLAGALESSLCSITIPSCQETYMNQILTFMVRDLERSRQ